MNTSIPHHSRGCIWFRALAGAEPCIETGLRTLLMADVKVVGQPARLIAVVPDAFDADAANSQSEPELEEGWVLADQVRDMIVADRHGAKRPIISIVDAESQAHGRIEELLGISSSCAAAAGAYAAARRAGHPLIALVVGSPGPGAFLAHGFQAHRLLAFDGPVAAGRAARRSTDAGGWPGRSGAPGARDRRHQSERGKLYELIAGIDADAPSGAQIRLVKKRVALVVADVRSHPGNLILRLSNNESMLARAAGEFRRRFPESWTTLDHLPVSENPVIQRRGAGLDVYAQP
jgi:malonate decarboxylase gamma subunit